MNKYFMAIMQKLIMVKTKMVEIIMAILTMEHDRHLMARY
jgi:hypothetical protein